MTRDVAPVEHNTVIEDGQRHRLFANISDSITGSRLGAGFAVLISTAVLAACGDKDTQKIASTATTAQSTETTPAADENGKCEDTWQRHELPDNKKNRVLENGLPVIGKADTNKEAREAVNKWWQVIRGDKEVSAQLAEVITKKKVKEANLFNEEGCATDYAEKVNDRVIASLAAADIKPGQASKSGYNSGLHEGRLVRNSSPGVSGNRNAALITLRNGTKFDVMSRCAQPVFHGLPPAVPQGPTDEKPNPRIKHPPQPSRHEKVCPPGSVEYMQRCVHKAANRAPAEASQPPHQENNHPTPGYPGRGNAESVANQQDSERPGGLNPTTHGTQAGGPGSSPGGGEGSVVNQPGPTATANPDYVPGTASNGTSAGTSNGANTAPAQTEGTGQTSAPGSDPGAP